VTVRGYTREQEVRHHQIASPRPSRGRSRAAAPTARPARRSQPDVVVTTSLQQTGATLAPRRCRPGVEPRRQHDGVPARGAAQGPAHPQRSLPCLLIPGCSPRAASMRASSTSSSTGEGRAPPTRYRGPSGGAPEPGQGGGDAPLPCTDARAPAARDHFRDTFSPAGARPAGSTPHPRRRDSSMNPPSPPAGKSARPGHGPGPISCRELSTTLRSAGTVPDEQQQRYGRAVRPPSPGPLVVIQQGVWSAAAAHAATAFSLGWFTAGARGRKLRISLGRPRPRTRPASRWTSAGRRPPVPAIEQRS